MNRFYMHFTHVKVQKYNYKLSMVQSNTGASHFTSDKVHLSPFSKKDLMSIDKIHLARRFDLFLNRLYVHSCPKVYIQLAFRFTFSAAISKSLELKRSLIAL